jgi:hypothetical protein
MHFGPADAGQTYKQQVAEACAFAAACADTSGQSLHASECVEWFAYRDWPRGGYAGIGPSLLHRLIACAPAADCKTFHACYGGSWVGPTMCREGGECSGNKMYTMSSNALYFHCDALGAECVGLPTGAIRSCCVEKPCAGTSETTCQPDPAGSATTGTHCLLGITYDFDCAPMGQVCSEIPAQLCVGPGSFCVAYETKVTCDGQKAKYCVGKEDGTGNIATVDCSTTVFRSACNADSTYDPCRPTGSECSASFAGECQGSNLLVCVDGFKTPVDCDAIGFDTCAHMPMSSAPQCIYAL